MHDPRWIRAFTLHALRLAALISLVILPAMAEDGAIDARLPRLVDLGAGKCIPCKKMAPILEELKTDYAGIVDVIVIDIWKDKNSAKPYGIRVIPTQIFFDREGKEVLRHEGFLSREEIEKIFAEKLGVAQAPKRSEQEKGSAHFAWPLTLIPSIGPS